MAATKDKSEDTTEENKTDEGVENPKGEDETKVRDAIKGSDEGKSEETGQGEDDSSQQKDESKGEKPKEESEEQKEGETKSEFEKRFTQFKGDTPEEYIKQLEDAYLNSSKEGQTLSKKQRETQARLDEVLNQVAKDPELAKRLNQLYEDASNTKGEEGETKDDAKTSPFNHPLIGELEHEWEKKSQEAVKQFEDNYPDFASDDDVRKEIQGTVSDLADMHYRKTGRMLPMETALRTAWQMTGRQLKEEDSVASKTKEAASQSGGSKPKGERPKENKFTKEQLDLAEKFGLTAEDLSKYNK